MIIGDKEYSFDSEYFIKGNAELRKEYLKSESLKVKLITIYSELHKRIVYQIYVYVKPKNNINELK